MAVSRKQFLEVTPALVGLLPERCSNCCFWECGGAGAPGECLSEEGKGVWISRTVSEGFHPGKLLLLDGEPLGYVQYAPQHMVLRLERMPFPRPSSGAAYLTCIYVEPEARGLGLGRALLNSVEQSLSLAGYQRLETHGLPAGRKSPPGPAGFFKACGFRVVTRNAGAPLMRLDLKAYVPWMEKARSAYGRLPRYSLRRSLPRPERPCT